VDVTIAPELAVRLRLGVLTLTGLTVGETNDGLAAETEALCRGLRERYGSLPSGEVPGVADARALYKALGLDPTKTRPSNEALLRRVLKGEALYRINTLVDALNLCALEYQLPFGLYDLARIAPPVVLRRGGPGESYQGIRKGVVHVEARPVLADALGPFGNPSADSGRTMITLTTTDALVTVYAPASYSAARLTEVVDGTGAFLTRFCGGRVVERSLLPS
jgi:DNA/RNA-binding domain of Phe-tRNA-synthetase-like protein